MLSLSMEQKQ